MVVEDVADGGGMAVLTARTQGAGVPCPECGTVTAKVHGYDQRTVKDVPVDGRQGRRSPARAEAGLPDPGLPAADVPGTDSRIAGAHQRISAARCGLSGRYPIWHRNCAAGLPRA